MFDLFLPQASLRALRLGGIYIFFSRKGAKIAKNFFICFVLAPNISACSASLREFIVFVSRRGAEHAKVFRVKQNKHRSSWRPWRLCERKIYKIPPRRKARKGVRGKNKTLKFSAGSTPLREKKNKYTLAKAQTTQRCLG